MKIPKKIGLLVFVLAIAGLALFIELLVRHGAADIAEAVSKAGWGLAAVVGSHCLTLFLDTMSWRALIPKEHRPALKMLLLIHWIGDSVSSMLPVAQVGARWFACVC